ncbi:MAG: hypothetical protein JSV59_06240 [Flavobacteriaceae bacterium]|nr:MAG: hypothetical protein JSV59_06240 [Flavobacteriaceae bacterium]
MITFFSKIRRKLADDNNILKYARYAMGEILLVVIGILIALQINNWNEERQTIIKEKSYVRAIYKDLKTDLRNITINIEKLSDQYAIGFEVLNALELKETINLDSATLTTNIGWELTQIIPIERKENTWDGLKVRGTETLIFGDSLKVLLNNFYGAFDLNIERFNQLPKKVREDLRLETGKCHDYSSVKGVYENGINSYGEFSPYLRYCILSNNKIFELVGAVSLSCIVNIDLQKKLKKEVETVISYMENQFDFLHKGT